MLKFFLIMLLTRQSLVLANECYKELCKGDTVRDQFGWKGTVWEFHPDNQEVGVLLSHIPSVWNFAYKDLGKKVWCLDWICTRQKVKDKYDDIVEVTEVFTHGMIEVFDISIDGHLLYDIDDLSPTK